MFTWSTNNIQIIFYIFIAEMMIFFIASEWGREGGVANLGKCLNLKNLISTFAITYFPNIGVNIKRLDVHGQGYL